MKKKRRGEQKSAHDDKNQFNFQADQSNFPMLPY